MIVTFLLLIFLQTIIEFNEVYFGLIRYNISNISTQYYKKKTIEKSINFINEIYQIKH